MNTLFGGVLAFVRDQGQPWYIPQQVKDAGGGSKFPWKKVGLGVFGVWFGVLAWLVAPWWAALLVGGLTIVGWSQGHRGGLDMQDDRDWPAMALTGLAVSMGLGVCWVIAGAVAGSRPQMWLGVLLALSGGLKPVLYWIGYQLRGHTTAWPHATAIGAVLHGAAMGAVADLAVLIWLLG